MLLMTWIWPWYLFQRRYHLSKNVSIDCISKCVQKRFLSQGKIIETTPIKFALWKYKIQRSVNLG